MTVLSCGCTPDKSGFGYCGECTRKLREKIWRNMSPERKAFDRHVDPIGSEVLDRAIGSSGGFISSDACSCHLNAPCSYCINKKEEEEEEENEQ